jgi:hypothetical protein
MGTLAVLSTTASGTALERNTLPGHILELAKIPFRFALTPPEGNRSNERQFNEIIVGIIERMKPDT